ncbi:MAG: fumarate reductase subunit, partial [Alphaproteobacteria bacterium]|nr:fumarate reductase subunit [Alphaproteobacteria bacterium]
ATALGGAAAFDSFLAATHTPVVKLTEGALVVALATHMSLGLRVLAIEFLNIRERTVAVLSGCAAAVFAVGLVFLLNAG